MAHTQVHPGDQEDEAATGAGQAGELRALRCGRRWTERAPVLSARQAGVTCAGGISALWPEPAGDTRAVGGRRTFLGEQDCLPLAEGVGCVPMQLPELAVSWIHLS